MATIINKIQTLSSLNIDAMFFHSAVNNLSIAKENQILANEAKVELMSIEWLEDYEAWELGDEIDVSFSDEDMDYVEGLKDKDRDTYSIFLQAVATTHIFCVAALEAHINKQSEKLFNGKLLDHFEKLPLEGKWLFLPQLMHLNSFTPGKQPFQNFSKLIKTRNILVHYKGKPIPYDYSKDAVEHYKSLGLTISAAEESITTTVGMVSKLAEILGNEPPKWLKSTASEYLDIETTYKKGEI